MNKIVDFIETKLAPPLIRVSQIRYLDAIQKAFMTFMPYLLISSIFILAASFPINAWKELIAPIAGKLWAANNATLGLISVGVSLAIGYHLGTFYKSKDNRIDPLSTGLVAMMSFLALFPLVMNDDGAFIPFADLGSSGLFSAIITACLSVEIYRLIIQSNISIKMPKEVPSMVSQAFTAVIPVGVVVIFWWIIVQLIGIDVPKMIMLVFAPLVKAGTTPVSQFIAFSLDRLLWFVGIHGSNVVGSVMSPMWTKMITDNIAAFQEGAAVPYLFSEQWTNYFVRVSMVPLIILMLRSKLSRYNTLGKLSFAPAIFNIAEPVMFGLPIVLNPIMFVPWVFGYIFIWLVTFFFTAIIPVIPPIIAMVPWTVPGPIAAYLGTGGNIMAVIISSMNYVIMFIIWLPFFKVLEKQNLLEEELVEETA